MSTWPTVELGDCVDLTVGFPFKSQKFLDQPTDAIRLLRGDNVAQGSLRWEGAKHLAAEEAVQFEGYALRERDVILAMDRPWIEAGLKYAYVRQSDLPCLLVQRVARLRGTPTLSTDFLRYIIGSPMFTAHVLAITTGVNVPHISGRDIKRFRFALPPLDIQRRIASILGAYDDLIEVNRQRGVVLEGMARSLFEEWFVRFRLPGQQDLAVAETPTGPLPNGWEWAGLGKLGRFQSGNNKLTKSSYRSEGYTAYSASGPDGLVDKAELEGQAIVVSAVGAYCGRTWLASGKWTLIANTFCVIPNEGIPAEFIYLGTLGYDKWPRRGAAQPFIAKADAAAMLLPKPPAEILYRFHQVARPILSSVANLSATNKQLAASRDLLLPRLISGQLSVAAAERSLLKAA